MFARLSIRQKTLLLFGLVALGPLLLLNLIWLRSSQTELKEAAAGQQSLLVSASAERVNQFINAKIDNAIIHSQIGSVRDFDIERARLNLLEYAKQDNDLQRISLVDRDGSERVVLNRLEFSQSLGNVASSDAFKVVTFLSGKEYIGPVRYDSNKPLVTLAVPLVSFTNRQSGLDLSTAEAGIRRGSGDIKGALIVDVSLDSLWQSVLSAKLGSNGYAYLIDDKGNLIAYPDASFISSYQNLRGVSEVDRAIKTLSAEDLGSTAANFQPQPSQSSSETGVQVLSSHYPVSRTKWAVIGEEPIASVYSDVNRVAGIALIIFVGAAVLATILIVLASRSLVRPIRQLTSGAVRLGGGDFSHPITITSHDELGTLAKTFNQMGSSLSELIRKYRLRNIDLAAERTKLKAVLDTMSDGVIALNHDFTIALVNSTAAKLVEQSADELYGTDWLRIYRLNYQAQPFHNQLLNTELPYFKDVVLGSGRQQKFLDITAVRLSQDPSGLAYIMTIHDTTASRQLEIMRLDFVSMAAHELRTPLTAVRGYLNLIGNSQLSGEEKKYLQRALASTTSLQGLINNLLSLSHIERGALTLKPQRLDWTKIVTSEVKNQQLAANDKQLKLIYHEANQPIWVVGDELALREVMNNLMSNAIHYTLAGGSIEVEVKATEAGVTTAVKDTGIGIALPDRQLFTKYYRVKSGLNSDSAGTGIGLFICKTIVEAHNGTIRVDSQPAKGSTFSFILPPFDEAKLRPANQAAGKRSTIG